MFESIFVCYVVVRVLWYVLCFTYNKKKKKKKKKCCDSKMLLYADDSVLLCTDKNIRIFKEKVKPNSAKPKNG